MATKKEQVAPLRVEVPDMELQTFPIKIVGDSPLITNAWSHKAKLMILQKQQKKASIGREVRRTRRGFSAGRTRSQRRYQRPCQDHRSPLSTVLRQSAKIWFVSAAQVRLPTCASAPNSNRGALHGSLWCVRVGSCVA